MTEKQTRQFGLWDSPISAKTLAGGRRLAEVAWDDDGQTLVWLEGRSDRSVLVAAGAGGVDAPRDLTSDLGYAYPGSEDESADPALAAICRARLEHRYAGMPERAEASRRLEEELAMIAKLGPDPLRDDAGGVRA